MTTRNIFSSFDFAPDEATIDTLRTDLAFALRQFIERSNMNQTKAAEVLGLKQSVVSQIVRGDIEHLSVERLIRAMVRARITGYAEWGESPELARAGAGFRAVGTASVVINAPMEAFYIHEPVSADNVGAGAPASAGAARSAGDGVH